MKEGRVFRTGSLIPLAGRLAVLYDTACAAGRKGRGQAGRPSSRFYDAPAEGATCAPIKAPAASTGDSLSGRHLVEPRPAPRSYRAK